MDELKTIQQELNAPKGQYNSFGKYKYRSCEDILAAVKPLLAKTDTTLTLTDDLIMVGNRIYIKATATIKNKEGQTESTTSFAREEEIKKGMDGSQITGTASSYARKYALNGLFCIDDQKDSDATNTHGKDKASKDDDEIVIRNAVSAMQRCKSREELLSVWQSYQVDYPALCENGSKLYNAAASIFQKFK